MFILYGLRACVCIRIQLATWYIFLQDSFHFALVLFCSVFLLLFRYICGDSRVFTRKDPLGNFPEDKCIVYSYGLGADWSFDNAAEERGCEVHGFDPTGLLWRQGMHGTAYANIGRSLELTSLPPIIAPSSAH